MWSKTVDEKKRINYIFRIRNQKVCIIQMNPDIDRYVSYIYFPLNKIVENYSINLPYTIIDSDLDIAKFKSLIKARQIGWNIPTLFA